jgi:rare lipoprotein A (peptidoglycan hydrolase)
VTRAPLATVFALAAVALLAVTIAFALGDLGNGQGARTPKAVGDFVAEVGSAGPAAFGHHTACGGVLQASTYGIAHPTLPCGARIILEYNGQRVLTQVVDRGPYEPGRQFDVTDALARKLDLQGVKPVRWSYAQPG